MTNHIISLIANSSKNNGLISKSFPAFKWIIFLTLGIFAIEAILVAIRFKTKKQNAKKIIDLIQGWIIYSAIGIYGITILFFIIGLL